MAYELLAGAWPFGNPGSILSELHRAVGECSVSPPHTVVTGEAAKARSASVEHLRRVLKGDLAAILLKALDNDPARRYPTVRDFADDIRRYLAGRPVMARRATLAYRAFRFAGRNRWRIALGSVACAALASACVYGFLEYGREQRRLVQIRDVNESYLTDIYREVSNLPGSTRASMLIVDRARKNLDALLPEAPRDPEMRRALAKAYVQLADIQGEPFAISLGDSAGALVSYRKGESLVVNDAGQPGDRGWEAIAILVRARQGIAEIQVRAGDYQGAEATLRAALEPARRLWQDGPKGLEAVQRSPAAVYIRINMLLGHALMRASDVDRNVDGVKQALTQFERTVAIAEEERRRHPEMPDLAGRYSQYVGYALELLGIFTGDHEFYLRARPARIDSTDRERVVLYAQIREALAEVLIHRHEPAGAVQVLTEAVAAVKGGQSVPPWRVVELEGQLARARKLRE